MGWKWNKADPDSVVWGDKAEEKNHDHGHVLVVHCDTQEDYDALVALLTENEPE